jgi:hypothetical protein
MRQQQSRGRLFRLRRISLQSTTGNLVGCGAARELTQGDLASIVGSIRQIRESQFITAALRNVIRPATADAPWLVQEVVPVAERFRGVLVYGHDDGLDGLEAPAFTGR